MSQFHTIDGIDVSGQRVLLRVDLNVPMKQGRVSDPSRITRIVPTFRDLTERGAKVIVLSHFDRPKGRFTPSLSLAPITDALAEAIGQEVKFAVDCIGRPAREAVTALKDGEVLLLENLRFHPGEEAGDLYFINELAMLGDVYINDAFSCSHRAHASITGIPRQLPAAAGRLMQRELEALGSVMENPERPLAAVVGGSKVSTKLALLENLVTKVQQLVIGGGMANTFLHAQGHDVGRSLCETDLKKTALAILKKAEQSGCEILLPIDAVIASALEAHAPCKVVPVNAVPGDGMILDIGPKTAARISDRLSECRTIVWNGPIGAFETSPFDAGTIALARTVAGLSHAGKVKSVAGGGDTVAALTHAGVADSFTYMSTAGGAFLEWLEGRELPGIKVLHDSCDSTGTSHDSSASCA